MTAFDPGNLYQPLPQPQPSPNVKVASPVRRAIVPQRPRLLAQFKERMILPLLDSKIEGSRHECNPQN